MISVDVILEDKRWSKKIKKPSIFFSKLLKLFQKRYSFSNKRANLSILLSNNNNIKKLNKKFRKKINQQIYCHFLLIENLIKILFYT